ncbi:MAG TPA: hypothetical protein PLH27_11650 [bacterium]|nr:hypothetical protein [bacterium]
MLSLLAFVGCSESEDIGNVPGPPDPPKPYSYVTDIKAVLDEGCASCHSGGSPSGSYILSTYAGVLGNGSDATPNAIPGDSTSLIILKLKSGHQTPDASTISMIFQWVYQDSCKETLPD